MPRRSPANEPASSATLTLRSLNKTLTNDTPCVWFESDYEQMERRERRKFLISEKTFTSSERPSQELLKYLQRDDNDPLVEIDPDKSGWLPVDFLYFPGFLKNAKLVDSPRKVVWQRGTLTIPQAHVGVFRWWRRDKTPETASVFESRYQVWLHPDLPLGFAHAQMRLGISFQAKESNSYDMEYTLQDFGEDAKPSISEESGAAQQKQGLGGPTREMRGDKDKITL